MGAFILYPHRAENMKKIGSELTGKFLQNDFFHLGTYFSELGIEFYIQHLAISTRFRSKRSVERPKQAKSIILLDFSRIFSTQNFLRYGQDLYQAHTGHSQVSSLPIGLLYLQHPLSNLALQNFFEIFVRYSQSLYKPYIRDSLVSSPYRIFTHPT